ncbi:hypothetical protein F1559_002926 [Cyanidiococcus yangmingshanensis]|uniref:Uncharacterized protein n=1 Tax=Cyanidiococcus yangmingshanensis TaxID=2690220 RepID=A0A7J7IGJ0_9RHOD|nr:hypothetical protein F1559_002926 [Cyanidiococcus yangmingshanensis]
MGTVSIWTGFVQCWVQDAAFTVQSVRKRALTPLEGVSVGILRARGRELSWTLRGCAPEPGSLSGHVFELATPLTTERNKASVGYNGAMNELSTAQGEKTGKRFSSSGASGAVKKAVLGLASETMAEPVQVQGEQTDKGSFTPHTPTEAFGGLGVCWEELEHPRLGEKLSIFERAAAEVGAAVWSRIAADDEVEVVQDGTATKRDDLDQARNLQPLGDFEIHPLYKDEAREMLIRRMRESRRFILRLQREIDDFPESLEKLIAEIDACSARGDRQRRQELLAQGQRIWSRHHEAIDIIAREELRMEEYLYAWGRMRCGEGLADAAEHGL